ncbi:MAG TPA: hypothetical protein VMV46_03845 [Thermoanaerobaculia bacterium]|nr:hypothetical protein [Thermoanaerobaculia bacterium]
MRDLLLVFLAVGGLAVWALLRWRPAVPAVLGLLVVEGAVRKWLVPEQQEIVYFAKDVLLLAIYCGYLLDRRRRSLPRSLKLPIFHILLALFAAWCALEVFNPRLPNLLVGLLGFKAYLWYVPLVWVVPAAFDNDHQLARFLRRYALLAIPVGLLATAQFFSPRTSALNVYARTSEDVAGLAGFAGSEFVRTTGTFSYITGFSTFLQVIALLLLTVLAVTRWRLRNNLLIYVATLFTILGAFMSGSRAPVLAIALTVPVFVWLSFLRRQEGFKVFARMGLAVGILAAAVGFGGADAVSVFYARATDTPDAVGRILAPFVEPFAVLDRAGLLGYGAGATHQAAAVVAPGLRPYGWLNGPLLEVETSRVLLELGAIGFLLTYLVRLYLVVLALRQLIALRRPFHRGVATASLFFFLMSIPGAVVFNVTADVYYWFFAGLLFTAMRLERRIATSPATELAAAERHTAGSTGPCLPGLQPGSP